MHAWVLMVLGLAALITGAELLVSGGSRLAARLGIPPIVVGVTVISLGTSTPELAIGVQSALEDDGTLALGNIAATNTCHAFATRNQVDQRRDPGEQNQKGDPDRLDPARRFVVTPK